MHLSDKNLTWKRYNHNQSKLLNERALSNSNKEVFRSAANLTSKDAKKSHKHPFRLTVIISLFELAHGKAFVRILGVDNWRSIVRRATEQYISWHCHKTMSQNKSIVFYSHLKIWKSPINPLSASFTKWSNTLTQFVGNLPTNCLSVFDHFVKVALKGWTVKSQLLGDSD